MSPRRSWTLVREPDPDEEDRDRWIASIRDGVVEVARVAVYGDGTPSDRNARLICSAPDLQHQCGVVADLLDAITSGKVLAASINWQRLAADLRAVLRRTQ